MLNSLYTDISINDGIKAVAELLKQDSRKDTIRPFTLKLLQLIHHSMKF